LLGRGDFLLVIKGEVVRFQAAYVSEREARWVVQQLRQGQRTSRRWTPESLRVLAAPPDSDQRPASCFH